jgi:hypothetical protein
MGGTPPTSARIGVIDNGRQTQVTLNAGQPLNYGGVSVSLDENGRVNVRGTDKNDKIMAVDGGEFGAPGSVVVSVETPGEGERYFIVPRNQASGVTVDAGAGNDDYWAPINDSYVRLNDTQGDNWLTNIGGNVTGNVSVADNQRTQLSRNGNAGGLTLQSSGNAGQDPVVAGGNSFIDSFWSWLSSAWR